MAVNGKVIITCAVTGAIHTPSMSPYLPITPEEIVRREFGKRVGDEVDRLARRVLELVPERHRVAGAGEGDGPGPTDEP